MTNVMVTIRGPEPITAERVIDLGEFHAVWEPGITIGSDSGCTVVLPQLPRRCWLSSTVRARPNATTASSAR